MQGFCTEKSWSSPNSCSSPNSWTPAVSVHPSCSIMQGCHCIFFPVSILLAQQVFDKLLVLSVLFSDFVALACPYLTRLLCACVWEELKPALRHYYTHTHAHTHSLRFQDASLTFTARISVIGLQYW